MRRSTSSGWEYSDQYSDDLYRYLRSKGYDDEILKDSGLVTIDEVRGRTLTGSGTVPCLPMMGCAAVR